MEFINDTAYLDQHFLIDKKVINDFVDFANITINDEVVEIGPGKGVITDLVVKRCKHLTCIEIDEDLAHFINVLKEKYDNIDIIYGNVLNTYIPVCDKIISALPYSITEPFIEKLLRCSFKECTLIVGKKFADSVMNKETNKLSLLTNSYFNIIKLMDITPDSFEQRPRVMSSIIKLIPVKRNEIKNDFKRFIFRELFFHREKKLKNNLMEALITFAKFHEQKLTKKESKSIVDSYNLRKETLNRLMENLSNEEFELIFNCLK